LRVNFGGGGDRRAERFYARRVELNSGVGVELRQGLADRNRRAIGPVGRHRLEGVGDKDDARLQRDLVAAESMRIAASVDVLMVVEHPPGFFLELRGLDDRMTDVNVSAHRSGLFSGERPGLAKNPVGDADFADVVEQAGQAKPLDAIGVEPELLADQRAKLRDRLAMVPRSNPPRERAPWPEAAGGADSRVPQEAPLASGRAPLRR
jgi:hypothetical protein